MAPAPAPEKKAVDVSLGAATAVAVAKPDPGSGQSSPPPATTPPPAQSSDQSSSGSNALLSVLAILLGLGLIYGGWRAGLRLWDRHVERQQMEVRWRREAEWAAVLRRIEHTQGAKASNGNGRKPRRAKVALKSVPLKARTNGATSSSAAEIATVAADEQDRT